MLSGTQNYASIIHSTLLAIIVRSTDSWGRHDNARLTVSQNARSEQLLVMPAEPLTNWVDRIVRRPGCFLEMKYQTCLHQLLWLYQLRGIAKNRFKLYTKKFLSIYLEVCEILSSPVFPALEKISTCLAYVYMYVETGLSCSSAMRIHSFMAKLFCSWCCHFLSKLPSCRVKHKHLWL